METAPRPSARYYYLFLSLCLLQFLFLCLTVCLLLYSFIYLLFFLAFILLFRIALIAFATNILLHIMHAICVWVTGYKYSSISVCTSYVCAQIVAAQCTNPFPTSRNKRSISFCFTVIGLKSHYSLLINYHFIINTKGKNQKKTDFESNFIQMDYCF